jgi:alkylhydroperoxidase family enzyme
MTGGWRGFLDSFWSSSTHIPAALCFTDRERAALGFIEAVARSPASMDDALDRARDLLSERELAELTAIAAEHHCFEDIDPNQPDA